MSTSHHGMSSQFSEELRQELIETGEGEQASIPDGRAGPDDDGALSYVVGPGPNGKIIRIEFGKPVEWIGLPPQQAVELAQSLIRHARAISKEPIVVQLH